jgi:uncharacterized protein (DUF433 family)
MPALSDLYSGHDPRTVPIYTLPIAARLANVPEPTLRSWVMGRSYPTQSGDSYFAPLIERPEPGNPFLSFVNVIEAHVLAAIRRVHGVPLRNVRPALDYVRQQLQTPHPLAERVFETDGVDLFVRQFGEVVNASRGGQVAFRELLEAHLTRIEHDSKGHALKLFPFVRRRDDELPRQMTQQPKVVMIDPRVSFGRPILSGSGVTTEAVADRFRAGESIVSIASDYECQPEEIEEALRYEHAA